MTHDGLSCVSEYLCPILNPPMAQSLNKALLHAVRIDRKEGGPIFEPELFLIERVVSIDAAKNSCSLQPLGKRKKSQADCQYRANQYHCRHIKFANIPQGPKCD